MLDAKAAAAAAVKAKYSGAKVRAAVLCTCSGITCHPTAMAATHLQVTIKKFGRKIEVPAESDAALTPTRQARRVQQKRRRFLLGQRALREKLEAVEALTHGPEAVAAARARGIATPPIKMRESLGRRAPPKTDAAPADAISAAQ